MNLDGATPAIGEHQALGEPWPADRVARWAKPGVVPIGTPVLHAPTKAVDASSEELRQLAEHMLEVMRSAPGIGLAANQVGIGARLFVHDYPRVAAATLINPVITAREGRDKHSEGCLSVQVEGARALVDRSRRVQICAHTLQGETVHITADDILARVFQHEIDHLDGIEYVQRLSGTEAGRVYDALRSAGVDVSCVPPVAL